MSALDPACDDAFLDGMEKYARAGSTERLLLPRQLERLVALARGMPRVSGMKGIKAAHASRVRAFAALMIEKLDENEHKGDWRKAADGAEWAALDNILHRIAEEVEELRHELMRAKRNIAAIHREAADVANFALIAADLVAPVDRP